MTTGLLSRNSMLVSVVLLALAEVLVMSLWFISSAIMPELVAESSISTGRAAALSSAVQIGFVIGAVTLAMHGTADRSDPRKVMALAALFAALSNLGLLVTPTGSFSQVILRCITGACLAGVYPVGMKIVVGWGITNRGLLVSVLVAALTVGSAFPHLLVLFGGTDWRVTVALASLLAAIGAVLAIATTLGPHHTRASGFDPGALSLAWTCRPVRLAFAGYLGHMWELYAFWAWISVAVAASFAPQLGDDAQFAARILTFSAIALGGIVCIPAGWLADRIGKAQVARYAMICSATAAIGTALSYGGPVWLVAVFTLFWGASVIPDSAQFSALVADNVPPERAGSLMTLQTALGFALTFITVQITPEIAGFIGWNGSLALMAIGPLVGIEAMRRLIRHTT